MFFKKKKDDTAQRREALLAAIPIKNRLVKERARGNGTVRLSAPLKQSWLMRTLRKGGDEVIEKSFELDDLGTWCWQEIDDRVTVEKLIERFARSHKVNIREAEVSVLAFLKMLTQRNLVALVAPKK